MINKRNILHERSNFDINNNRRFLRRQETVSEGIF